MPNDIAPAPALPPTVAVASEAATVADAVASPAETDATESDLQGLPRWLLGYLAEWQDCGDSEKARIGCRISEASLAVELRQRLPFARACALLAQGHRFASLDRTLAQVAMPKLTSHMVAQVTNPAHPLTHQAQAYRAVGEVAGRIGTGAQVQAVTVNAQQVLMLVQQAQRTEGHA